MSQGLIHDKCKGKTILDGAFVIVHYNKLAKQIMKDIKYNLFFSIAEDVAEMMKQKFDKIDIKADLIVPIPLHKKRLWKRGFNQAELLSKRISLKPDKVLVRAKNTITQVGLDKKQRLVNLKEAFVVNRDVKGKKILLVDDVMTTGTTFEECAMVLKASGAEAVYALAWARD